MTDIPVALFVYRRAETVRQVLDCLRADQIPLLYIFSDGPRGESDAADVASVRDLIREVDWCERVIVERPSNLGLGASVRRGVSEVLRDHGSVVVYEDDIISVPGTYAYLAAALRQYETDQRVMSVTGWTHPRITPPNLGDSPYFDGKSECWAWGAWARSWQGMDDPPLAIMRDCAARGTDIEKYGTDLPKMAREAEWKNLWAAGWFYHHMRHGGLCLRPPWSMAEQICWDEGRSTTTTEAMMADWANPPLRPAPLIPTDWPEPVENAAAPALWRQAIDGG